MARLTCWDSCSRLLQHAIPHILWNPKDRFRVYKSLSLDHILNQVNSINILVLSFHLRLGLSSGLFPSDFPTKFVSKTSPAAVRMQLGNRARRELANSVLNILLRIDNVSRMILHIERWWQKWSPLSWCLPVWKLQGPIANRDEGGADFWHVAPCSLVGTDRRFSLPVYWYVSKFLSSRLSDVMVNVLAIGPKVR
jgi:hypothetical protein